MNQEIRDKRSGQRDLLTTIGSALAELNAYRALFDRFVDDGTWHDIGPNLSTTELNLVIEAARIAGYSEWADLFETSAREDYEPEGYAELEDMDDDD